jgi:hypothetical protein
LTGGQGDAQVFAETLQVEIDKDARAKEVASARRRKEGVTVAKQDELPDFGRMRGSKTTLFTI